jgi:flagellar protein FlaJ
LEAVLVLATLVLAASAIYLQGTPLLKPALIAAVLLALVPLALARYHGSRKRREMASRMPAFLHDMGHAIKAGLSHPKAAGALAAKDYGALNPELSRMRRELSEGKSFEHSLRGLADRLEGTHSHHVLHNLSFGGDFHAAGMRLRELDEIEEIESLRFRAYALSLYALFFIFSIIVSFLQKAFPPQQELALFHLIWIQAVFTGIAAGKLAENSFLSGAKHALVLFIIGAVPYIALSGL